MKPDYMKYDGRTEEPPYQTECDDVSYSELNGLLVDLDRLALSIFSRPEDRAITLPPEIWSKLYRIFDKTGVDYKSMLKHYSD